MVKSSIWSWARDEKICREFEKLTLPEVVAVIIGVGLIPFLRVIAFILGFKHNPSDSVNGLQNFFWLIGIVIIISRTAVFYFTIHWPPLWSEDARNADRRVYIFILLLIFLYVVILLRPGTLAEIFLKLSSLVGLPNFTIFKIWEGFRSVVLQELEFRLLLYYSLNCLFGRNVAFFATAAFFGMWHEDVFSYQIAAATGGAIFSVLAIATGSIVPAIVIHSVVNLAALFLVASLK